MVKFAKLLAAEIFRLSSMVIIFFTASKYHAMHTLGYFIIDRLALNAIDDEKFFNFCSCLRPKSVLLISLCQPDGRANNFCFLLPLKGLSHKMDLDLTARKTLFAL
jgi:hypothetical protein